MTHCPFILKYSLHPLDIYLVWCNISGEALLALTHTSITVLWAWALFIIHFPWNNIIFIVLSSLEINSTYGLIILNYPVYFSLCLIPILYYHVISCIAVVFIIIFLMSFDYIKFALLASTLISFMRQARDDPNWTGTAGLFVDVS